MSVDPDDKDAKEETDPLEADACGTAGGPRHSDRSAPGHDDHGRGSGPFDGKSGLDDSYGPPADRRVDDGGRDYGRHDYERRGHGGRSNYGYDEPRYSGYPEAGDSYRRREDDSRGTRAWYEEAGDYIRGRYDERGRGPTRSHVRCRDIMTRDVTVATREMTLQEVAVMMRDEDTGVIPVVEREAAETNNESSGNGRGSTATTGNGRLVGLITDRDIVVRSLAEGKDPMTTRAEEVMTTDIHTAQLNDRVIETIRKMGDKQVRRIPVVDDKNNLRGIISMADVALETEEDRELADALEEISSGASFWSKVS